MPITPAPLPGSLTRAIGRVFRDTMQRRSVTLRELAAGIDVSEGQLSRMLSGKRRIDLDQVETICLWLGLDTAEAVRAATAGSVLEESPPITEGPYTADHLSGPGLPSSKELARRLRELMRHLRGDPYETASKAAAKLDIELTRREWGDLREGIGTLAGDKVFLETLGFAFGATGEYLITHDVDYVERLEAVLDLAEIMKAHGTSKLTARAFWRLSGEEIRGVIELLQKYGATASRE